MFVAGRGERSMMAFWMRRIAWPKGGAEELRSELFEIRNRLGPVRIGSISRFHMPPLANFLERCEMGGQAWIKQFAEGVPMIGDLAKPGVYPASAVEEPKLFQ